MNVGLVLDVCSRSDRRTSLHFVVPAAFGSRSMIRLFPKKVNM
jgi:hypothetical protein